VEAQHGMKDKSAEITLGILQLNSYIKTTIALLKT